MIWYVVMWKVVGVIDYECSVVCIIVKMVFESLCGWILGMMYFEIGVDFSVVDYVCDLIFVVEFELCEVFDGYVMYFEYVCVWDVLIGLCIVCYQVDYVME